jgi:hypothetical protein
MTHAQQNPDQPSDADTFAELMGDQPAAPVTPEAEAPPAPPEQGHEEAPPAGELEGSSQTDPNVPEWLQSMPDEARQTWQNLVETNQRLSNDFSQERQARMAVEGRLRPIQQKLSKLEQQQQDSRAAAPQPVAPQGQPNTQLDSFYDSPSWKKFEDEFPEEAATQRQAMEWNAKRSDERIQQLEEKIQSVVQDPRLAQINEFHEEARLGKEKRALAEMHPDWEQINQSQEFLGWLNEWRLNQPAEVHDIYMDDNRFRKMCTDANFAGNLLNQYKRDAYLADLYYAAQQGNNVPAAPQPRSTSPLLALSASPNMQGTNVPRRAVGGPQSDAETFDKLFNS